jgi:putative sterol carrier protein
MAGGVATAGKAAETEAFASAAEMREVLIQLLAEIDKDSDLGRRMRSAHLSYRYVFTDLGLTLNVTSSDDDTHNVRWSFAEDPNWNPELTLEMSSDVANRYLQGRENLAIAMARGRIRCSCEARAALSLLPINRQLSVSYREVLERDYPHLLLR